MPDPDIKRRSLHMPIVEEPRTERRLPLHVAPSGPQEHHLHTDYYCHPADRAVFPIDLYETEEGYTLFASLPGTDLQDVQLRIADTCLTIDVRKCAHEGPPHRSTRLRAERYAGPLLRTIVLPAPIRADAVCATYERGVLTLHLVKDQAKDHSAAHDAPASSGSVGPTRHEDRVPIPS
jgi:HSP20 family molecular chaperone IbpA